MDRRVLLLVLLLAEDERLAAKSVLDGLSQVTPGLRVAVVDGQAQLRTLTPLSPATHLAGVPHLSGQVDAPGLHSRLGHHLYGLQIQLELDDRTPGGYVVACIWGEAAKRISADLGDYAAFAALDLPVEVQHYFLGDTSGGLRAKPPSHGSGISVQAWLHVDPADIAERVEALAEGKFPPLDGAVVVDLGRGPKARGTGVAQVDRTGAAGGTATEAKAIFATAKAVAALSDDPEWYPDMLTEIGVAEAVAGLTADAKATFSWAKAVTTFSDNWDGWKSDMLTEIGRGEAAAGLTTEAKATFSMAKAITSGDCNRDSLDLLTEIGMAWAAAGRAAEAQATFNEAKAIVAEIEAAYAGAAADLSAVARDLLYSFPRRPVDMLTEIGVAEAAAGLTINAKATFAAAKAAAAALIDPPDGGPDYLQRAVTLTEIARAEVAAGLTSEAKVTAAHLDTPSGALMLREIARAEAAAGHASDARATFAAALAAAHASDPRWWLGVEILTELAEGEAAAGHASDARATFAAAKAAAVSLSDDRELQSYMLKNIALAEGGAGHTAEAKATFTFAKSAALSDSRGWQSDLLADIALAEAAAGHTTEAEATFAAAKAAAYDERNLADIARAEVVASSTPSIVFTFASIQDDYSLGNTVAGVAAAYGGDPGVSGDTRGGVGDREEATPKDEEPTPPEVPQGLKSRATPDDVAKAEAARAGDKAEDAHSKETADVFGASLAETRLPPMAEGTYRLTGRFGMTGGDRSSGISTGLDFAGPVGTPVIAAASGEIVSTGYQGAYGNQVVIDHGYGYQTSYSHLSGIGVSVGDTVSTGDQIGKRGSTGNSRASNLHFEVTKDAEFIDPESWLGW